MPTDAYIRERLVKIIREQPNQQMKRRALLKRIGATYRNQAAEQISVLLSSGFLLPYGSGTRGDPKFIIVNNTYPSNNCPCCGQSLNLIR